MTSDVIWVHPQLDGRKVKMMLDTGSAVSIISDDMFYKMFKGKDMMDTSVKLRIYSGETIAPTGVITVQVTLDKQCETLALYVVRSRGPPLLGRDWLKVLKLDWREIKTISRVKDMTDREAVESFKTKYEEVFAISWVR